MKNDVIGIMNSVVMIKNVGMLKPLCCSAEIFANGMDD